MILISRQLKRDHIVVVVLQTGGFAITTPELVC
jgi:hypothetical protein